MAESLIEELTVRESLRVHNDNMAKGNNPKRRLRVWSYIAGSGSLPLASNDPQQFTCLSKIIAVSYATSTTKLHAKYTRHHVKDARKRLSFVASTYSSIAPRNASAAYAVQTSFHANPHFAPANNFRARAELSGCGCATN